MNCPYCHHELKPLIISGRPTGSFQCEHCTGTWLQYQTFSGLLPGPRGIQQAQPAPGPLHDGGPVRAAFAPRPRPAPSRGRTTRIRGPFAARWKRKKETDAPAPSPDWDICTYCGKLHPGSGPTCVHCNVERMTCPACGRYMVGVRKHGVLVDICLSCRGLWFEKGRLEKLIESLSHPEARALPEGKRRAPSLLHQLATFLEDTEPAQYGLTGKDPSVVSALSSAFGAGLTGSKRILYDVLVLLGDLQSPPEDPDGTTGSG